MPDQDGSGGAEWLTVKQYAVATGCTTQAVYKRLATTLQPHVKTENGRTYIHSRALQADSLQPVANPSSVANPLQTRCKPDNTAELAALDALRDQISRQAAELETVREQLETVRAENAELKATAAAADAERKRADAAEEQCKALTTALQTAQQSQADLAAALTAAQALHAGTMQQARLTVSADGAPDPDPEQLESKGGLFRSFFRKKKNSHSKNRESK